MTDVLTKEDVCFKHCLLFITAADSLSFTHCAVTHVHRHEQIHTHTLPISHKTASDTLTGSPRLAVLLVNCIHGTLHRVQERLDLIGRFLQKKTGHKLLHVGSSFIYLEKKEGTQKKRIYDDELFGLTFPLLYINENN